MTAKREPFLHSPLLDASESVLASKTEGDREALSYGAVVGLWSARRALLSPHKSIRPDYMDMILSNLMSFLQGLKHHYQWLPWDDLLTKVSVPRKKNIGVCPASLLLMGEWESEQGWVTLRRIAQNVEEPKAIPSACRPLVHSVRAALLASTVSLEHWQRFAYVRVTSKSPRAPTHGLENSLLEGVMSELSKLVGKRAQAFARSTFDPSSIGYVDSVTEKYYTLVGITERGSMALGLHFLSTAQEQEQAEYITNGLILPAMLSLLDLLLRGVEDGSIPWRKDGLHKRFDDVSEAHRLDSDELLVLKMVHQWDNCRAWVDCSYSSLSSYLWKRAPGPSTMNLTKEGGSPPVMGDYRRRLLQYLCSVLWTAGSPQAKSPSATITDIWNKYLSPSSGSLFSKGLLVAVQPMGAPDVEDDPSLKESCEISLDRTVNAYLEGTMRPQKGTVYSSMVFSRVGMDNVLPLPAHHLSSSKEGALLSTLRMGLARGDHERGVHVLLHGLPGTGKTELARSLASYLGSPLVQPSDNGAQTSPYSRFWRVRVASLNLRHGDIMLVDEADGIINSGSEISLFTKGNDRHVSKEAMNVFLDKTPGVFIWVANTTSHVPSSTMRRFDYVLESTMPGRKVRQSIAASMAGGDSLPPDMSHVVDSYPLSAAGLHKISSLARLPEDSRPSRTVLEEVAASHLNSGPLPWRREGYGRAGVYDPAFVQVSDGDHSLESLEVKARRFLAMPEAKRESVGLLNLGILLYGPPGTGKTAWGRYLASALDRPLVEVAASSLLDKYVGGTEESIRRRFMEAEEAGAVLLVDEADALLGSREGAEKSWEISQVEQFLCSMESFKGILVCTTNFDSHLDKALLRRFYACLRFGYMGTEASATMLVRCLRALGLEESMESARQIVSGLGLTPSDFGLASKSLALEEDLSVDRYVHCLRLAADARTGTRKFGF